MRYDNNSNDRRIFARIGKALSVRLLASGQDEECKAETVDISGHGLGILGNEKLSPNTQLEMWLDLPGDRGSFYTRGEVVWSWPLPDRSKQRTGIRLEKAELIGLAPILWK
ncbi:MAG: PilZ domain-containing protein [Candidatus Omnitrophica bacterium]|nr:PilZ domain-containing protein [Candidatus Omnitrophota bacterium]MBU1871385.1 PilZ domain-containing protein [Candidatus Omnitrophota bacterium]